jgi:hypothetical protein
LQLRGNWEDHLPLMEFTYNNNDQAIIEMVSYKGLYNRKCRTPICWDDMSDRNLIMLELVLVIIKKIKIIKDIIKATQDRKKKNVIRIIEGGLSGLTLEIGCF